jgi:SNF2 family DNA or RNA helicase
LSNPARVEQLVGRIRRTGSVFKTTFFIQLLTRNTFEEKIVKRLEQRQAVINQTFDESSDIVDSLSSSELLSLFKE